KVIKAVLQKNIVRERNTLKVSELVQGPEVYSCISYPGANGYHIVPGEKNTEGDILDGKIRILFYLDPGSSLRVVRGDRHNKIVDLCLIKLYSKILFSTNLPNVFVIFGISLRKLFRILLMFLKTTDSRTLIIEL